MRDHKGRADHATGLTPGRFLVRPAPLGTRTVRNAVLVALAASLVGTPLARRVAHRFGVLDQPSARKVHRTPTPLLGGLAIYAGFWVSVIAATRLELPTSDIFLPATTLELAAIFLATIPLVVVGFLDDKYKTQGLPPRAKLAAQFLSAGIASAAGLELRVFDTLWLDLPLTCLWVVGITNAINLLDLQSGDRLHG
ncbi:MAG: undecaprenyl/decaprenyl-phosphate alpha-N-acetylglucosaminyl 1-phosphate transferase [Proteobacteria bacterium]|nr:undecaprenyl/decaprenyl-phosphate alpha-N-acetylglucosaminyl 1-phosphate transferase [Pseudomonadota bacterium]